MLIYLVRLAERCHVDLPAAVVRKFQLNAEKYPATVCGKSNGKNTGTADSTEVATVSCDHSG